MAKNQTRYSTNASNTLGNDAQGLTNTLTPEVTNYLGGIGGAQGSQQNTLNTFLPSMTQNLTTGGYDPTQLAGLRASTANFASTGGYDPTQLNTINAGYGNLATTGGFTPGQEQDFVRQATEGSADTYKILEDQSQRAKAATGGLGTGGDYAQLARQASQSQAQNTLNAEVGLNNLENSNKLAGLGGLSSTASNVAGNRLAGSGQQLGLESGVAQGSTAANSQFNNLFNTQTNQVTQMGQQLLQSLGISYNSQAEAASILAGLSKNPGAFQTAIGDITQLGGVAAGIGGAFNGKPK